MRSEGTRARVPVAGAVTAGVASSLVSVRCTANGEETRPPRSLSRPAWVEAVMVRETRVRAAVVLGPGEDVPGTRYRIRRWLGEGAMGVVYEVEHLDLGRRLALKILRRELCRDAAMTQLFRDEARIVSRLGAENIVEVFDFGELPDGRLTFSMELLEGRMLADEIAARSDGMDPARVVGILRQVCKGLAVAHAASIVHRDIKPANIALISKEGRPDGVKLLDFGLASMSMATVPGADTTAGTPYYLAPEIIAGLPCDYRADIYALGCTAYQMLVGRPPFEAEAVDEILSAHLGEDPVPPAAAQPGVPPGLSAVVMRCVAKAPEARPVDVADLEALLVEAQIEAGLHTAWDDLPLPDVEPDRRARLVEGMPDPVLKWYSDGRRLVWMVAAMLIAFVIGVAFTVDHLRSAEVEHAAATNRVEQLTIAARAAAAKSLFVYPSPDAPTEPTAYRIVLELERLSGELGEIASQRGSALREAFAATLVRLGDEYWVRDGGKPFAIDYYAAALVFEPENGRASSRVGLTPGQLAMLGEKAQTLSFTTDELVAAEPLIALAEPDASRRTEALEALRDKQRARLAEKPEQLAALTRPRPPERPPERQDETPSHVHEGPPPEPSQDRGRAEPVVARARAALSAGHIGKAKRLFERGLGIDPANAVAMMGLSQVYFHQAAYGKAARYAEKGVRLAPRDPGYRIRLGDAYYKAYRYDDALEQYEHASRRGHPEAASRLSKVNAKLTPNRGR